jgi:Domain of unknown function (DUF3943)
LVKAKHDGMNGLPHKTAAMASLLVLFVGLVGLPAAGASVPRFSLVSPDGSPPDPHQPASFSLAGTFRAGEERSLSVSPTETGMPKKWRRALIQLGILSVYSTVRYWLSYHDWIEDWQFQLTVADQYRRFFTTEAIRFDSNAFVVNWTHAQGGAVYYEFARTNYLTWAEALLCTFTASASYEYVSEWREVISVNDMIVTTFGGYSLGETWYQLSDFFHHQRSPVLKVLGFMNPINEINQWLDRKKPASRVPPEVGWHDFVFSAGWRRSAETGRATFDTGLVSLDTQIVRTPEYGRPGTLKKVLRDTSLSELAVDVALRQRPQGADELRRGLDEEVDLYARVVGLALYRQSIDEAGRGYALSIGLGSALTYLRKRPTLYDSRSAQVRVDPLPETPTDFRDKMTVTHLFGPVLDWTRFGRGLKMRVVADAYVDFALMNAFAFNAYSAVHPIEGMKTTLNYYGYHYAYGASASGRIDLDWGNVWLRGLVSGHFWDSWKGLDRFESELTNNVNAVDTRTRFLIKAGWRVASIPVRPFVALEAIHRWGKIGDVRAGSWETRTFAGLSYLF